MLKLFQRLIESGLLALELGHLALERALFAVQIGQRPHGGNVLKGANHFTAK